MSIRSCASAIILLAWAHVAQAQWREVTVGSEAELYVRAMQIRGTWTGEGTAIRPYGPQVVQRWMGDSVMAHPWQARFTADSSHVQMLRPSVALNYNSAFPWGFNDGATWAGRGTTAVATAGFVARWRWASIRIEPLFFRAENRAFTLLGDTSRGVNPFVDQQRPGTIDLPQRFGNGAYQRLDPGQSELRIDAGSLAIGFSTMNQFWGPGIAHSLILTANAPGIPRLFIGTSRAIVTPIGRINAQLLYGKLAPSGYEPTVAKRDRFGSGLVASWQPPSGRGFELGLIRFFHRFWPDGGLRVADLTVPFGSFFNDVQVYRGGPADNQLVSVFARLRGEESGFEVFGEFGRTDRAIDVRDLSLEPEQNSAWTIGAAKSMQDARGVLYLIRAEYANGRISSIQRLARSQGTFYEHTPITQGHTQQGQLLGTPLLERTGGLEIGIDRWAPWGRLGATIMQRALPEDDGEGVRLAAARSQWYTEASVVRFVGWSEVFARGGLVFDLNRRPGSDGKNLHLLVGVRLGH